MMSLWKPTRELGMKNSNNLTKKKDLNVNFIQ